MGSALIASQKLTNAEITRLLEGSPYIAFLGLTCEAADTDAGTLTLRMPMRAEMERGPGSGQFHGGPIAGLVDTAGDFAVMMAARFPVPTVTFSVDYLRPAFGDYLLAHARTRRVGRTIGVADVEVTNSAGSLVAIGRGSYATNTGEIQ